MAEPEQQQAVEYARSFALDGIEILRAGKGGDGRTVEAYAAIFDAPQEITDQHGHYNEVIERTAFNRTLSHGIDRVGVFYNHGLDLDGKPAPLGHIPIGHPVEIKADGRGLRTVTRFNESPQGDHVLEAIRNGDIRGYSFRGGVFRSDPRRPPRTLLRGGALPTWRHKELGLREYGPTWTPAYAGAGIVAIRSALTEVQRMIEHLSSSTPEDPDDETATPNPGPGTEDSLDDQLVSEHSGRLQLLRLRRAVRERGIK